MFTKLYEVLFMWEDNAGKDNTFYISQPKKNYKINTDLSNDTIFVGNGGWCP